MALVVAAVAGIVKEYVLDKYFGTGTVDNMDIVATVVGALPVAMALSL